MTLPTTYRKSPVAITSYDYSDIASGTGYENFKGFTVYTGAGTQGFVLSPNDDYSTGKETTDLVTNPGTSYQVGVDLTFDSSVFKKNRKVKGKANVVFGWKVTSTSLTSGGNYYAKAELFRVRSGAETSMGSSTTAAGTLSANETEKGIYNVEVDCSETAFQKGDTLRLDLSFWVKGNNAGTIRTTIGHDPKNRDGTYVIPSTDDPATTTILNTYIPFDLRI